MVDIINIFISPIHRKLYNYDVVHGMLILNYIGIFSVLHHSKDMKINSIHENLLSVIILM